MLLPGNGQGDLADVCEPARAADHGAAAAGDDRSQDAPRPPNLPMLVAHCPRKTVGGRRIGAGSLDRGFPRPGGCRDCTKLRARRPIRRRWLAPMSSRMASHARRRRGGARRGRPERRTATSALRGRGPQLRVQSSTPTADAIEDGATATTPSGSGASARRRSSRSERGPGHTGRLAAEAKQVEEFDEGLPRRLSSTRKVSEERRRGGRTVDGIRRSDEIRATFVARTGQWRRSTVPSHARRRLSLEGLPQRKTAYDGAA